MANLRDQLQRLKSLLSAEELEQLRDDPASLLTPDDDLLEAPTESPRMGAGPDGPLTGLRSAEAAVDEPKRVAEVIQKFDNEDDIAFEDVEITEAIIRPLVRPAILIQDDDYHVKHKKWRHLNEPNSDSRNSILSAIPAVGRINVPSNWSIPYAGTGFIVGENLLMTNRHVAELFADGLGKTGLSLKPGTSVNIDFKAEHDSQESLLLQIEGVRMIHPYWDMALLEVEGIPKGAKVLTLSQDDPSSFSDDEIAVIGYPAFDPRNNREVQNRLFNRIYDVKRLHPGLHLQQERIRSFDKVVLAATHDASTLGGCSGSTTVHLATGTVVGLHFGGIYERANFAVPAAELARDPHVVRAGVEFAGQTPRPRTNPWSAFWALTETAQSEPKTGGSGKAPSAASSAQSGAQAQVLLTAHQSGDNPAELSINVPLKLSVSFGLPETGPADGDIASAETEKMVEPAHDTDYSSREGYDPNFLGIPVPMPEVLNESDLSRQSNGDTELRYYNFSLLMNAKRRLAQVTASNVDASEEAKEPEDGFVYTRKSLNGFTSKNDREKWFLDPRIPAEHQLPDLFYNRDRTAFDKGHLVRREAVAFGDSFNAVQMANGDTFHSTNCSPQVKGFNRSNLSGLWGKLENDVLDSAENEKCVVFCGPVFDRDDREFHGRDLDGDTVVQIPSRYWKMIITRKGNDLRTHAYVLSQDLSDVDFEFAGAGEWVEHEVDPDELERIIGTVRFPHLTGGGDGKMSAREWRELVEDPRTTDQEIMEVSIIQQGAGAFDFLVMPDPAFVHLPEGDAETENAMAAANQLSRTRRAGRFKRRTFFGDKSPVLVSEMDSWGQFPVLVSEIVDHLNKDYRVWSLGAAGDTALNMVHGPQEPGKTEYMLGLDEKRKDVKGFIFSAAGNDIIGEDPATGKPVLTDLLRPFNGDTSDVDGHINHALLENRLDFLRNTYDKVISTIRADADFKKLPIFIHGYDYPFPYPWTNDHRRPLHAAKDQWLGRPFTAKNIEDRVLRREILKVFIDKLYAMLSEFSGNSKVTKVWLVNCRGAMPNLTDWIDEIHGTSNGFRKVATRFKASLIDAGVKPGKDG